MVCFVGVLVAAGTGCGYVAVGNERSANEGAGVKWIGEEVNHQYDKSYPFERKLHNYIWRATAHDGAGTGGGGASASVGGVGPAGGLYYFSLLMPFWDVQVVELFSRVARQYLPLILSCNEALGRNHSRWCASCEKCAFVFALLSAFLECRAPAATASGGWS